MRGLDEPQESAGGIAPHPAHIDRAALRSSARAGPSGRPIAPRKLVDANGTLPHQSAHLAVLAADARASTPAPRRQVCETRVEGIART